MKQLILLVCLVCAAVLPPNTLAQGELYTGWYYPYNNSTQRTYTPYLARIKYIYETGNDVVEYDVYDNPIDSAVTLQGDVDEADIIIERLHPTCWRLIMTSDYTLLRKQWQASIDVDGVCYQQYLPTVYNGTQ